MRKQMVTILSNMSILMCHAFIKDPSFMPWEDNVFNYEFDEQLVSNNEKTLKNEKSYKRQHQFKN